MAFAFVSTADTDNTSSAGTIAQASFAQTVDNLICVWVTYGGATTTVTVSDGDGTYAAIGTELSDSSQQLVMFWKIVQATGTRTITATFGSARNFRGIAVAQYSADAAISFDVQNAQVQANPGTGTDGVTTGTATNTATPALVCGLAFSFNGNALTEGTSMTERNNDLWGTLTGSGAAGSIEDRALATTGAFAATWTASVDDLHFSKMGIFTEASPDLTGTVTAAFATASSMFGTGFISGVG